MRYRPAPYEMHVEHPILGKILIVLMIATVISGYYAFFYKKGDGERLMQWLLSFIFMEYLSVWGIILLPVRFVVLFGVLVYSWVYTTYQIIFGDHRA